MTAMSTSAPFHHEPVMCDEICALFDDAPPGTILDATLGGAGHAHALLSRRADLSVVGIDRDPAARRAAAQRLNEFGDRFHIIAGRFGDLRQLVADHLPNVAFAGVLFDFGVSSPQLDRSERGFSFRHDGPLDMRMNPDDELTAADIVNTWTHGELARLLKTGADERFASRIAERIIAARPFSRTTELADVVVEAIPAATRRTGGHPAKRTFQALRIAVNSELEQIPTAIDASIDLLAPDGRGAILSYHSGEDRLTKQALTAAETGGCTCPPRLPCACGADRRIRALMPRLRRPGNEELLHNPRSASARLRCFARERPEVTTQ